jgi:glucosamine--fructose-6-phosphate aminotransferase (isomerizing)
MAFELPAQVRAAHPYFMYDEIISQPLALRTAIEQGAKAAEWPGLFAGRSTVYLTGCGTSFHAAMVGEHWLRTLGVAQHVRAAEAFELALGNFSLSADDALIAFSQGGGKSRTLEAARLAKKSGASVLAVTGHQDSPLAGVADALLWTGVVSDISWAHTVSYSAALAGFLRLALNADGEKELDIVAELGRVPDAIAAYLRDQTAIRALTRQFLRQRRVFLAGSGVNLATALEGALKMRETNYAHADGIGVEYFLHGPVSSLDSASLLIAIAPSGAARQRAIEVLSAARTIGAATLALGEVGDAGVAAASDAMIELPPLYELLTPLLYVVPLQLLAYWQSVELGVNPDLIRRDQQPYLEARRQYVL